MAVKRRTSTAKQYIKALTVKVAQLEKALMTERATSAREYFRGTQDGRKAAERTAEAERARLGAAAFFGGINDEPEDGEA